METTQRWLDTGVIRRFAPRSGITRRASRSTRWACGTVLPHVSRRLAGLTSFPEVSYCYEGPRKPQWPTNLYTMIHAKNREEVEQISECIAEETGLRAPRLLYSTREFKKSPMRYFTGE